MATSYAPPLPPDVVRQQRNAVPAAVRFAQQGGAPLTMGPRPDEAGQVGDAADPTAQVVDVLQQVATTLAPLVGYAKEFKPFAMVYLGAAIKALKEFQDAVTNGEQPSPPASQTQAQMPSAPDQAGAVSMG